MGKPKTSWVSAPTPPEMQETRRQLGQFFGAHGLDTRGQYGFQLNADPGANWAYQTLARMFSGILRQGGNALGGGGGSSLGTFGAPLNTTYTTPTMPTSYYTGDVAPESYRSNEPEKEEKKKGPTIFAVGAK